MDIVIILVAGNVGYNKRQMMNTVILSLWVILWPVFISSWVIELVVPHIGKVIEMLICFGGTHLIDLLPIQVCSGEERPEYSSFIHPMSSVVHFTLPCQIWNWNLNLPTRKLIQWILISNTEDKISSFFFLIGIFSDFTQFSPIFLGHLRLTYVSMQVVTCILSTGILHSGRERLGQWGRSGLHVLWNWYSLRILRSFRWSFYHNYLKLLFSRIYWHYL